MKRSIFGYIATLCAGVCMTFASCSEKEEPVAPEPKCTVLVYMVADNNLGGYGVMVDSRNLSQMQKAVNNGGLNGGRLLVFYDPYEVEESPRLLEITEEGVQILKTYTEDVSCLDPDFMRGVLDDAAKEAPAPKNWLVLWSHGTGWIETADSRSAAGAPVTQSFGKDVHPEAYEMNITTLASVLGDNRFYDVIYFDCCFMGCAEVMYELRNAAKEIVASPTELPIEGMPYEVNIPAMFADDATAETVAKNTLNYYLNDLTATNNSCSISVINTSAMDEFAEVTRSVNETGAIAGYSYVGVPLFRRTGGTNSHTYDMGHYINSLGIDDDLKVAWNDVYKKVVTYYGATPVCYGLDMSEFTGLGCHVVNSTGDVYVGAYYNQSWWKDVVSYNPSFDYRPSTGGGSGDGSVDFNPSSVPVSGKAF